MLQKVIIEVDASKPFSEYGDGHMLVWDSIKKNYYITTRESFLQPQNQKIAVVENDMEELKTENSKFMSDMESKFNDFLTTYKDTNAKLIEMVKEMIKGEDSK